MDINKWRYAGRPLTVLCACYLVSCVLHLVSVPVSKNLCYLHLCGSLYFLLAMMGYTLPVLYQVILRLSAEKLTGRPWWYRRSQR